jgi:hypothetical protein
MEPDMIKISEISSKMISSLQNADDIRTAYDEVVSTNVQAEASLALKKF